MSDGFLGRWSKRKQAVREGEVVPQEPVLSPMPESPYPPLPPEGESAIQETPPPPTLEDAQALTPESDFKPFMARGVAPEVKNVAFKKLFADPHFNVMDGMDTYIDDYSQSTPIPPSVLRQMVSAQFLRLFDDDEKKEGNAPAATDAAANVAQSTPSGDDLPSPLPAPEQAASQETDDHADLRLQPDDAARRESDRGGAA